MKEIGGASSTTTFFILTLILCLIFGGILNANTTISLDAFAKKKFQESF